MHNNKECFFTANSLKHVDYKDVAILKKFVNPHGRMIARKRSGLTAIYQRKLALAIKRSRFMGLMPYLSR